MSAVESLMIGGRSLRLLNIEKLYYVPEVKVERARDSPDINLVEGERMTRVSVVKPPLGGFIFQ